MAVATSCEGVLIPPAPQKPEKKIRPMASSVGGAVWAEDPAAPEPLSSARAAGATAMVVARASIRRTFQARFIVAKTRGGGGGMEGPAARPSGSCQSIELPGVEIRKARRSAR